MNCVRALLLAAVRAAAAPHRPESGCVVANLMTCASVGKSRSFKFSSRWML